MNDTISLQGLRKVYQSGSEDLVILDDISLDIPPGSLVVVTGESGSGKTTFLNLLAGLDKPSGGSIRVGDWEVGGATEARLSHYRSRVISLVFQFHYLLKEFTALENVMLPAWMAGESRRAATERARGLLELVGLGGRTHHFPSQLSGGERQRAAVARALVNDPALLLADEPTGNLDERNSRMVEELLFDLAGRFGKTLVLVTHNSRLAEDGTKHLHLAQGRFTVAGSGQSRFKPAAAAEAAAAGGSGI
jgi:lipoprotein-releasing system ATP-binding protein